MRDSIRLSLLLLMLSSPLPAQIWQFPGGAIDDLTRLTLEELFDTWQPKPLPEAEPSDPGEYVQYRHETLTYFFGPFESPEAADNARNTLKDIQAILLRRDPKFATSEVSLHHRPGAHTSTVNGPQTVDNPAPPLPLPTPLPGSEAPEAASEAPPPASASHPVFFWISTLLILALSGIFLHKM